MIPEEMPQTTVKKFKILIVDDEVNLREFYKTLIRKLNDTEAQVFEADNAADAVRIIQDENPHLAILDLELRQPKNGWDIIREVRAFNQVIKIFILSAHLFEGTEDQELLNRFRVTKAIKKAVNTQEFKYYVHKILHDEEFFNSVDKVDHRIIKHRLEIRHLLHEVKNKISKVHADCAISALKFTTDDYIKKDPEKAANEAAVILDQVAVKLELIVDGIDETDVI